MQADITGVNHVGLACRDLEVVARWFSSLGFCVTPESVHRGARTPGGPVEPLGSANRCVVFPGNYLEILGKVDTTESGPASSVNRVDAFLARHEGAHIVCFDTPDASSVHRRMTDEGVATGGVVSLTRDISVDGRVATAAFDRVLISASETPEGLIQAAHHRTPELIHQERYMRHPNGVMGLDNVTIGVADPDESERRYARYVGRLADRDRDRRVFHLPDGSRVTLVDSHAVSRLLPEAARTGPDSIVGVGMVVNELSGLVHRLDQQGVRYTKRGGAVHIDARDAFGVALSFTHGEPPVRVEGTMST